MTKCEIHEINGVEVTSGQGTSRCWTCGVAYLCERCEVEMRDAKSRRDEEELCLPCASAIDVATSEARKALSEYLANQVREKGTIQILPLILEATANTGQAGVTAALDELSVRAGATYGDLDIITAPDGSRWARMRQ